jgi:hypothetical protein
MNTQAILPLCLSTSILLAACGSSSPEAYIETSIKISCQYLKKCQESSWNAAGYDSVADCRNQLLDEELGEEGSRRDRFVESCTDFDSSAARECLAALRKAKRDCASEVEEPACSEVCGMPDAASLSLADSIGGETAAHALEQLEAASVARPTELSS